VYTSSKHFYVTSDKLWNKLFVILGKCVKLARSANVKLSSSIAKELSVILRELAEQIRR